MEHNRGVKSVLFMVRHYRYVNQGKGMLQRHQLLAEFDALFDSDKEKYAPFADILRAAQVTLPICLLECVPIENQQVILISFLVCM
jgi:hypothetical protein